MRPATLVRQGFESMRCHLARSRGAEAQAHPAFVKALEERVPCLGPPGETRGNWAAR